MLCLYYGEHIDQYPDASYRVEKYRPVTLDDVVSHGDITSTSTMSAVLQSGINY